MSWMSKIVNQTTLGYKESSPLVVLFLTRADTNPKSIFNGKTSVSYNVIDASAILLLVYFTKVG